MQQKPAHQLVLARLSVFFLLFGLLAACGTPQQPAQQSQAEPAATAPSATEAAPSTVGAEADEVVFWSEYAGGTAKEAMDAIVAAFNAEHPDIRVTHVTFATNNDYEAALKTAFASGDVPDLVQMNAGGWLTPYVDADQLTDLSDIAAAHADAFDPGTLGVVTYRDRQWAVPFGKIPGNLIFYNRTILEEQGIDPATLTTWSAFTDALAQLKSAGITPIVLGNKEGWPGAHWLGHLYVRSMGVEKATELFRRGLQPGFATDLRFTDPAALRPWQLLKELQDSDYFSAGIVADDFPTAYAKFFNGEGAFFQTGGWLLSIKQNNAPDFDMGFMLFPALDGVPESNASDYVFNAVAITLPKGAKNLEKARTFIEWWYSSETPHRMWSEMNPGELPAMRSITTLNGVPSEVNQFLQLQADAAHSTMFIDSLVNGDLSQEILWEPSNGLFSGALTAEQAAENAEQRTSEWQTANPN